jgi:heptaprenyl diphosphate synthase
MTASPHRGDQCQAAISQPGSPGPETRSAGLVRLGMLSAAAVAVYVFEGLIPMPLPWARLGLSNVVVVVTLFGFGVRPAILVAAVRIVAGNLLLGIMLSPAFLFSIAGSCAALAVMAVARWKMVPPLSVVGVSVAGAVANNVVQVMVFVGLFAHTGIVANLLGLFMLLGVGVGLVTGLIAAAILPRVLRGAGANLVVTMFLIFVAVAAFTLGCGGQNPRVLLRTDLGDIIIEVYPDRAPITATNFLRYVNEARQSAQ